MASGWDEMNTRPRRRVANLLRGDLPEEPGVYAFYLNGEPVYVGLGKDLRDRVWKSHMSQSRTMGRSALRRNIAEQLGIATAVEIKMKRYRCSAGDLQRVRDYLERLEISWMVVGSPAEAVELEDELKREFLPPLTKR